LTSIEPEEPDMDVTHEIRDGVVVTSVTGSIDALTAPALAEHLSAHMAAGRASVVADLSGVDYTSSAGLRTLLGALKDARQRGGDFRLSGVQPQVRRVLDLSGFTSIVRIYDGVDEAVASFAP
jgi:anti-sigma B factor antagonist